MEQVIAFGENCRSYIWARISAFSKSEEYGWLLVGMGGSLDFFLGNNFGMNLMFLLVFMRDFCWIVSWCVAILDLMTFYSLLMCVLMLKRYLLWYGFPSQFFCFMS